MKIARDRVGLERLAQEPVDLAGAGAEGQMRADDRPDAAAGDAVDHVAGLLEHLQHADVRVALGAAGAEGEAELGPRQMAGSATRGRASARPWSGPRGQARITRAGPSSGQAVVAACASSPTSDDLHLGPGAVTVE